MMFARGPPDALGDGDALWVQSGGKVSARPRYVKRPRREDGVLRAVAANARPAHGCRSASLKCPHAPAASAPPANRLRSATGARQRRAAARGAKLSLPTGLPLRLKP